MDSSQRTFVGQRLGGRTACPAALGFVDENASGTQVVSPDPGLESRGQEAIRLERVVRRFGEVIALDHIDLTVRPGEFFSLLGPSGCGKTTLLRLIAGLDFPNSGMIYIGGENVESVPAHRRPVNTVFQSYALFPHLDVWHNIAFGLRMKGVAHAEQVQRVSRVMDTVQIANLARRRPSQLSGGQKQRVALARAIVNEPKVLLLDEPLGALDLKLRKQLQAELHALQKSLGITFLYVTHDQDEALAMSDRIAVMNHGRIEQLGSSECIYEHPRTRFVAQFLGSCNLLEARVDHRQDQEIRLSTPLGALRVSLNGNGKGSGLSQQLGPGGRCTLAIRPEKVLLQSNPNPHQSNVIRATVADHVYSGAETQYRLRCADLELRTCALNSVIRHERFRPGDPVSIFLPPEALVILED